MEIKSYEDLVAYLRQFETWGEGGGYDFVGVVHLLGACLDNLGQHAIADELETIEDILDPVQWSLLKQICISKTKDSLD